MPDVVPGGGVDGCGPGPGCEVVAVGEPGDVADLDREPCCTGGPDAVQVQQPGAGGSDQFAELLVGILLPGIDPLQIADQLSSEPASGLAGHVTCPDLRQ